MTTLATQIKRLEFEVQLKKNHLYHDWLVLKQPGFIIPLAGALGALTFFLGFIRRPRKSQLGKLLVTLPLTFLPQLLGNHWSVRAFRLLLAKRL